MVAVETIAFQTVSAIFLVLIWSLWWTTIVTRLFKQEAAFLALDTLVFGAFLAQCRAVQTLIVEGVIFLRTLIKTVLLIEILATVAFRALVVGGRTLLTGKFALLTLINCVDCDLEVGLYTSGCTL